MAPFRAGRGSGAVDHRGIRSARPGFAATMEAHAAALGATHAGTDTPDRSPDAMMSAAFDADYYLGQYADVRASGMDPFGHFLSHGASELRNPNAWFDTGFYLRTNADVVDAEINPFWHYLAHGKGEGRAPGRRHRALRAVLAEATPPAARWAGVSYDGPIAAIGLVRDAIAARLPESAGPTLAVSHDRYTEVVGGVQVLVSDEQAAFNRAGETYLHVAPAVPRLMLGPPGQDIPLHLTIDGAYVGVVDPRQLGRLMTELAPAMPALRRFVVHCLLGHQVDALIALHRALRPAASVFWVNDYEAVCVGFNLLRNDVAFCGGPPPGSMACRVCVYGADRNEHLAQLGRLFGAVPFHVVAPSRAALTVWANAARLPHVSVQVHEYAAIRPTAARFGLIGADPRGTPDNPVRIAFVGYAAPHKGWPAFMQVMAAIEGNPAYQAWHFAAAGAAPPLPGVQTVLTRVTAGARGAMTDALIAAQIDLVLVLSTWPETFCLVAYEATAAGADIVALPESGNVADMVLATGRGVLVPDAAALVEFFVSGAAVAYVRMCGDQGSAMGRVVSRGMTATLPLPGAGP